MKPTACLRRFSPAFADKHPEVIRGGVDLHLHPDPRAFLDYSRANMDIDYVSCLSGIICSTPVIAASVDSSTSVEDANVLQGNIPNAELKVMEGAVHCKVLEQPEVYDYQVLDFLGRIYS